MLFHQIEILRLLSNLLVFTLSASVALSLSSSSPSSRPQQSGRLSALAISGVQRLRPFPHPLLHRSTASYGGTEALSSIASSPSTLGLSKMWQPSHCLTTCTSTCCGDCPSLPFQLFQLALFVPYRRVFSSSLYKVDLYRFASSP